MRKYISYTYVWEKMFWITDIIDILILCKPISLPDRTCQMKQNWTVFNLQMSWVILHTSKLEVSGSLRS